MERVERMVGNQKGWVSAHLYYSENWEAFLTDCVRPLVSILQEEKLISQYFFIRYWEQGPHIRLRLLTSENEIVSEKLNAHVEKYYNKKPSERKGWEQVKQDLLYANNSIQWIAYEAEVKRYGGKFAISVAEPQFELSSNAVLSILSQRIDWNNDVALGTAIQVHLVFAHALGMDANEAKAFFHRVFMNWLPKTYYSAQLKESPKVLAKKRQEVLDAFHETFDQQKTHLKQWVQSIWEALDDISAFEDLWIHDWYKGMHRVGKEIKLLQKNGSIEDTKIFRHDETVDYEVHERWSIYDSYVHMTNNRLGVMNKDEGYLGYLLSLSLGHSTIST